LEKEEKCREKNKNLTEQEFASSSFSSSSSSQDANRRVLRMSRDLSVTSKDDNDTAQRKKRGLDEDSVSSTLPKKRSKRLHDLELEESLSKGKHKGQNQDQDQKLSIVEVLDAYDCCDDPFIKACRRCRIRRTYALEYRLAHDQVPAKMIRVTGALAIYSKGDMWAADDEKGFSFDAGKLVPIATATDVTVLPLLHSSLLTPLTLTLTTLYILE